MHRPREAPTGLELHGFLQFLLLVRGSLAKKSFYDARSKRKGSPACGRARWLNACRSSDLLLLHVCEAPDAGSSKPHEQKSRFDRAFVVCMWQEIQCFHYELSMSPRHSENAWVPLSSLSSIGVLRPASSLVRGLSAFDRSQCCRGRKELTIKTSLRVSEVLGVGTWCSRQWS